MLERLLAAVTPMDSPHGYNLTFAFPMLLFIITAGALYLRFRSPHKVPGHAPFRRQPAASQPAPAVTAAVSGTAATTVAAGAGTVGSAAGEAGAAGPEEQDEQQDGTETSE